MWHASIARIAASGAVISTGRWGDGTLRDARRRAMQTLDGIGDGPSVEALRPACLHIRRSLAPEEMRALSAEWLAIPARDEFSQDGAMEDRL